MKMKRTIYHVLPNGGKSDDWKLFKQGNERATSTGTSKAALIKEGRELARNGDGPAQLIIHNSKGVIQTEYTYKNDPEKYKG